MKMPTRDRATRATGAPSSGQIRRASDGTAGATVAPTAISLRVRTPGRWERDFKNAFDRAVAIVMLILLSPLLLVLALAVLVTLGRPVLFIQKRVGQDGVPFEMLKFRSMRADRRSSDSDRRAERRAEAPGRRNTHKTQADPRHTRLGQFMRRFSLDELPQFINVLRGELSIVGPRPELLPVVEAKYDDWQHRRHTVKPGITGLWQVSERSVDDEGEMHEHVEIDLLYVDYLSARLDFAIMALTPAAILGKVLVRSARNLTDRFGARVTESLAEQPLPNGTAAAQAAA